MKAKKTASKKGNKLEAKKRVKLGKKKLKSATATNISFKSKSVYVQAQNLRSSNSTQEINFVTKKNLTLKDISNQLKHYNDTKVKEAMTSLNELVTDSPLVLYYYLGFFVKITSPLIIYTEKDVVRDQLICVLHKAFQHVSQSQIEIYIGQYVPYIESAMNHLGFRVRVSSLDILLLFVSFYPDLMAQYASRFVPIILHNLFSMSEAGIGYKSTGYQKLQRKAVIVLNLFMSNLLQFNRLSIPSSINIRKHSVITIDALNSSTKSLNNQILFNTVEFSKDHVYAHTHTHFGTNGIKVYKVFPTDLDEKNDKKIQNEHSNITNEHIHTKNKEISNVLGLGNVLYEGRLTPLTVSNVSNSKDNQSSLNLFPSIYYSFAKRQLNQQKSIRMLVKRKQNNENMKAEYQNHSSSEKASDHNKFVHIMKDSYNLETEDSLMYTFDYLLKGQLLKLWIEYTGNAINPLSGKDQEALDKSQKTKKAFNFEHKLSSMLSITQMVFIKQVSDILYQLLYALEDLQIKNTMSSKKNLSNASNTKGVWMLNSLQQKSITNEKDQIHESMNLFYKPILTFLTHLKYFSPHVPLEPASELSEDDDAYLLSTNVSLLGTLSFVISNEELLEHCNMPGKEKEDTENMIGELKERMLKHIGYLLDSRYGEICDEDFGKLLGVVYRIKHSIEKEKYFSIWINLTRKFMKEKMLSIKQRLLVQFFEKVMNDYSSNQMNKNEDLMFPEFIIQTWCRQLTFLLNHIEADTQVVESSENEKVQLKDTKHNLVQTIIKLLIIISQYYNSLSNEQGGSSMDMKEEEEEEAKGTKEQKEKVENKNETVSVKHYMVSSLLKLFYDKKKKKIGSFVQFPIGQQEQIVQLLIHYSSDTWLSDINLCASMFESLSYCFSSKNCFGISSGKMEQGIILVEHVIQLLRRKISESLTNENHESSISSIISLFVSFLISLSCSISKFCSSQYIVAKEDDKKDKESTNANTMILSTNADTFKREYNDRLVLLDNFISEVLISLESLDIDAACLSIVSPVFSKVLKRKSVDVHIVQTILLIVRHCIELAKRHILSFGKGNVEDNMDTSDEEDDEEEEEHLSDYVDNSFVENELCTKTVQLLLDGIKSENERNIAVCRRLIITHKIDILEPLLKVVYEMYIQKGQFDESLQILKEILSWNELNQVFNSLLLDTVEKETEIQTIWNCILQEMKENIKSKKRLNSFFARIDFIKGYLNENR